MSLPLLGAGKTAPTPAGPATEVIRPSATSFTNGTVTGATAHAALSDQSDDTFIDTESAFESEIWIGAMGNLAEANGRQISSFTVTVRTAQGGGPFNTTVAPAMTGATTAASAFENGAVEATDFQVGPFLKSGGGNFTAANIDSMSITLGPSDGAPALIRTYEVWVTVTYAS